MSQHIKYVILLILVLNAMSFLQLYAQPIKIKSTKVDTIKAQIALDKNDEQIRDLKNQIVVLTQTVADTKESFYNSNIYLWSFIVGAMGLILVFLGFIGYNSISTSIEKLKSDNEKAISKSETDSKEIKQDLIQRITDLRQDNKEFRENQTKNFEKFQSDSNEKIQKGLDLALKEAINNIVKGTISKDLKQLSEQIFEHENLIQNILAKLQSEKKEDAPKTTSSPSVDLTSEATPPQNTNAFNEES